VSSLFSFAGHSEVSDHGLRSVSTSSHGSEAYLYKSSLQEKTTGASVFTMAELKQRDRRFFSVKQNWARRVWVGISMQAQGW